MKALLREGRARKTVFLNGVSYARDLGYRSLLEGWEAGGPYPVQYIPTVSRPSAPANAGWDGRVGRVEAIVAPVCDELGLTPDNTIAYICGNPDMILSAEATLLERGFPEEQVKKELYWPKGKEPRGPGGTE
jgi:NAD(P)H-flavin reductase